MSLHTRVGSMIFSRSHNPPPTPEDERWALPPQPIELPSAQTLRREKSKEQTLYTVPRRFDIATLLTVSFAYSLLFTMLRLLDAHWPVFAFIGGLTVVIGLAQALYPYGNEPRWASALAGIGYCLLWTLASGFIHGFWEEGFFCAGFASVIVGPLIGYLSGACEAGVFLVADMVRRNWFPAAAAEVETPEESAESYD